MEIDRRKFVTGMAFAGGAAAGLMLSPAPWYLLRDAAFWTQNWPWAPTPVSGESSHINGICRMCDSACGITVRKVGVHLVSVDGNDTHPVNRGSLCPLGYASLQMLYGPARLKSPLRRVGGRSSSSWESISWDAALAEVSATISALRANGKPQALACISAPDNSTVNRLLERLLTAVGSPNFIRMPSYAQGLDMAHSLLLGGKGAAYDIEHARCILSFGSGLYEGWGAFGRMYRARLDWSQLPEDERPEIIQVDANLSVTANQASRWVPIRPGTEGALALGIAHVLIRDELYDKSFVDNHCFGFRDDEGGKSHHGFASEVLARYSPESVEKITQAPAREIEELARYFASHRPALALGGGGRGDRFSNLYALMSVHSLNALVGNINRRGGVFNQPLPPVKAPASARKDETARRGLSVARCDGAGGADYPLSDFLPHNIDARQVEILFVHEANPYYSLPDRQARELFENIPFIVSFSSYMDESAAQADLILPLSTPFERWDDTLGASGTPYPIYTLSRPLTDPLYDTRSAGDIAIELARRLGGSVAESFPWAAAAEVLKQNARDLYDANRGMVNTVKEAEGDGAKKLQERYPSFADFWGSLIENGCWYDPALEAGEALPTRSGKFEFYSQALREKFGFSNELKCMPHYSEPEPSPEGFDLLVMPEDLITMAGDGLGAPPLLIKQLSDNVLLKDELFVRVNPVTAMLQRLKDGDLVILESTRGKAKVRAHVSSGVREGVVVLPLGFGHTAYDEFLRDKGVNGCQLIEARKDPVSGLLCCCGTPAKLRKA